MGANCRCRCQAHGPAHGNLACSHRDPTQSCWLRGIPHLKDPGGGRGRATGSQSQPSVLWPAGERAALLTWEQCGSRAGPGHGREVHLEDTRHRHTHTGWLPSDRPSSHPTPCISCPPSSVPQPASRGRRASHGQNTSTLRTPCAHPDCSQAGRAHSQGHLTDAGVPELMTPPPEALLLRAAQVKRPACCPAAWSRRSPTGVMREGGRA